MSAGQQPDLFSVGTATRTPGFDGNTPSGPARTRRWRGSHFDGPDFDQALDGDRLTRQLDAVRAWMLGRDWQSLAEIAEGCGFGLGAVASISARLRDLRKARFGGYLVERRRRTAGTWEHRVSEPAGETLA